MRRSEFLSGIPVLGALVFSKDDPPGEEPIEVLGFDKYREWKDTDGLFCLGKHNGFKFKIKSRLQGSFNQDGSPRPMCYFVWIYKEDDLSGVIVHASDLKSLDQCKQFIFKTIESGVLSMHE